MSIGNVVNLDVINAVNLQNQNQKLFIAMYIYIYKECVMVVGASIDNNYSAIIKNINISMR